MEMQQVKLLHMAEEHVEVPKVSKVPSVASTVGFFAGQTGLTRRIVAEIVWPKDPIAIEDEQLPTMTDFGLLVSLSFQNCCGDQTLRLVTPKRVEGLETCVFSLCLEEEEKVVGLAYNEVKDDEGSLYFHACLLIQRIHDGGRVESRSEPLSRHLLWPEREVGRPSYVPKAVRFLDEPSKAALAVKKLRSLKGQERDHIMGAMYESLNGESSVLEVTGQTPMFWFELLILQFALWYLDVVLDVKQLSLFWHTHMYDYMVCNLLGLLLPIILTMQEVMRFLKKKSPEVDMLETWSGLSRNRLQLMLLAGVLLQCHMLLLTFLSIQGRQVHPLLAGAKFAEVGESLVSALVQMNFLLCALTQVESFVKLEVSASSMCSLAFSVAVSCFSLGLGLATRDKTTSRILGLPGKLQWSFHMALLVFVRSMEVASRVLAINILHVSIRTQHISLGGPATFAALLLLSRVLLPEAEAADLMAAIIGHPGQILEPTSVLPLRNSLCLHGGLVLAALMAQVWVQRGSQTVFEAAKVVPCWVMVLWLGVSFLGIMGLILLERQKVEHPMFQRLHKKRGEEGKKEAFLTYSALLAELQITEVPRTVSKAAVSENYALDLDLQNFQLDPKRLADTVGQWQRLSVHGCAVVELLKGMGAEDAAVLLRALAERCQELDMDGCGEIPVPWKELCMFRWERLRKANFTKRFESETKGAEGAATLLEALSCCNELEELNLSWCSQIPSDAWDKLQEAQWTKMRKANLRSCFNHETKGSYGANAVLQALSRCRDLEDLSLAYCCQIPTIAWWNLRDVQWSRLKKATFKSCFRSWSQGFQGAVFVMEALSRCRELEDLSFEDCQLIDCHAWEKLRPSQWTWLQRADFHRCFGYESNDGAQGADALMEALSRCRDLEDLSFEECQLIPCYAWEHVNSGTWPSLRRCLGVPEHVQVLLTKPKTSVNTQGSKLQESAWTSKQLLSAIMPGRFASKKNEAPEVLRALSPCCDLEDLNLSRCQAIPVFAWRELCVAQQWTKLKRVNFASCFDERSKDADGSAELLEALSRCSSLEDLNLNSCWEIPAVAWEKLRLAQWPKLKRAHFAQCFNDRTKGATAADVLLKALRSCRDLEDLNLSWCLRIPSAAWKEVRWAQWEKLKKADFELSFWSRSEGAQGSDALLEALSRCGNLEELWLYGCVEIPSNAWEKIRSARWTKLKKADFGWCFSEAADGAAALLQTLSHCDNLEDLYMRCGWKIPSIGWEELSSAQWTKMKRVSFISCFGENTNGADGAATLLQALSHADDLEELKLEDCPRIPKSAWKALPPHVWPRLKNRPYQLCKV